MLSTGDSWSPITAPVRILYRPVGPKELALIVESGYRELPPRLPEQPILYPVTNEEYARRIAEKWNVKESGSGYVTRFAVREEFIARYPVQQARECTRSTGSPPRNSRVQPQHRRSDRGDRVLRASVIRQQSCCHSAARRLGITTDHAERIGT